MGLDQCRPPSPDLAKRSIAAGHFRPGTTMLLGQTSAMRFLGPTTSRGEDSPWGCTSSGAPAPPATRTGDDHRAPPSVDLAVYSPHTFPSPSIQLSIRSPEPGTMARAGSLDWDLPADGVSRFETRMPESPPQPEALNPSATRPTPPTPRRKRLIIGSTSYPDKTHGHLPARTSGRPRYQPGPRHCIGYRSGSRRRQMR